MKSKKAKYGEVLYRILAGSARGELCEDWCWCPSHAQLNAKLGKWHPAGKLASSSGEDKY